MSLDCETHCLVVTCAGDVVVEFRHLDSEQALAEMIAMHPQLLHRKAFFWVCASYRSWLTCQCHAPTCLFDATAARCTSNNGPRQVAFATGDRSDPRCVERRVHRHRRSSCSRTT